MFSCNRNMHLLISFATVLWLQNSLRNVNCDEYMQDLCPCVPRSICPQTYGLKPSDEFYLGTILKCKHPDEVRCCGVSNDFYQSVSTNDNEIDSTTQSYETTESTNELTTIPSISEKKLEPEKIHLSSNESIDSIPSYMNIINNVKVMLVYATKNSQLYEDFSAATNDITTTEKPIEFKPTEAMVDVNSTTDIMEIEPTEEIHIDSTEEIHIDSTEEIGTEPTEQNVEILPTEQIVEIKPTEETFETTTTEEITTESIAEVTTENIETTPERIDIDIESLPEITTTADLVEFTTTIPQIDLNELKEIDNELNLGDLTTELVSNTPTERSINLITTTVAAADRNVPDSISTIEFEQNNNRIEPSKYKRRNSIYGNQHSNPINPVESTSASFLVPTFKSRLALIRKNTTPRTETTTNQKMAHEEQTTPPTPKEISMKPVEEEHKSKIMELHSLLSTIGKKRREKTYTINRSNSLQQLVANEKSVLRPSFGYHSHNGVRKDIPESVSTTTETIETTTQAHRKYGNRFNKRKFNESSLKMRSSTTTTTESPIVSQKETSTSKSSNRYTRRRPSNNSQTIKSSGTVTIISTESVMKPSDPLRNIDKNANASLERRKKLFGIRRRSGSSQVEKPSETTMMTNAAKIQANHTMEIVTEKTAVQKSRKLQHRFKINSNQTNDGEHSNAKPSDLE